MLDEETGAEPRVISASIADPYLLLVRDDSSIMVAQIDNNCELEEVEKQDDTILATKWLAGCLYTDTTGLFAPVQTDKGVPEGQNILMFLLSAAGALYVSYLFLLLISMLTLPRYTLFPISLSLSMLPPVSPMFPPSFPPTTPSDEAPFRRRLLKYWWPTSEILQQPHHTLS